DSAYDHRHRGLLRTQRHALDVRTRARRDLLCARALGEPADRALTVFHTAVKRLDKAFGRQDPYVVNGLVKKWEVRPWNVVVGNEPPSSSSSSAPAPGTVMRRWTARTAKAQLPEYLEHFSKNVLPELRRVHGYLGAAVFLRRLEREIEIVVETNWDSLESVRNFAGPDLEAAVVAPVAAALLTGFDRRALHSEVVLT